MKSKNSHFRFNVIAEKQCSIWRAILYSILEDFENASL